MSRRRTGWRMPEPEMQRQVEEEEETLQAKPLAEEITPLVQRQVEPEEEEEEEPIQTKLLSAESSILQRQKNEEEEEEPIQTKRVSTHAPAVTFNLASRIQSLRSSGQPLREADRSFMERRFGVDFSMVRVHTDSNSVRMN